MRFSWQLLLFDSKPCDCELPKITYKIVSASESQQGQWTKATEKHNMEEEALTLVTGDRGFLLPL